jgi:signal transduction histidine kinase
LRELTVATRAVAQGSLEQQVPVRSQDELGELAGSFNQMAADLARSYDLRRQMTADIAHDLRTPLSVILSHAEALRDGVLPPTRDTFEIISDEAQRLNRLVDDLHTLSLAEAEELPLTQRAISPRRLLADAAVAHGIHAVQRNISLEVDAGPELPDVNVDPDRMAQVLDNLLDNALHYTPAGGQVTLSASGFADFVQLRVVDSGPGIAPEDIPHIFERFYRGDRSRQRGEGGAGLGLAIAKALIEAHGGRIWVESELGQGTTFIVELPRMETAGG